MNNNKIIKYNNKIIEELSIPLIQQIKGNNIKTSIIKPWLRLSILKKLEDKPHNKEDGIDEEK
jgi:hypothetical protein